MLTFEICGADGSEFQYRYFRENTKDAGIVAIDVNTCEGRVIELAPGDEFHWYAFHLKFALEEMARENNYKESGTVMWY